MSVAARFVSAARASPGATALVAAADGRSVLAGVRTVTYGELLDAALRGAGALREWGAGAVLLCCDEGEDMVVGVMSCVLAGAPFVPCDLRDWPAARVVAAAGRTGAALAVVPEHQESLWRSAWRRERAEPPRHVRPSDLRRGPPAPAPAATSGPCYVIFTSGSTGEPKGVVCGGAAAVAAADARAEADAVGPGSVVMVASHFVWDPCVCDIFLALLHGAALCAAPRAEQLVSMLAVADACRATHITATPVLWGQLPSDAPAPPSLRVVSLGGQSLPPGIAQSWSARVRLQALYGVTEATGYQTAAVVQPGCEWDPRCIGAALPGYHVAVDGSGEIVVAGAGLAWGYDGMGSLTAASFVPRGGAEPGERMYATGDSGEELPGGGLRFTGRRDLQVKVRGQRLELGDVEAVMERSPLVTAAVAEVRGGRLVCHVELRPEAWRENAEEWRPRCADCWWPVRTALDHAAAESLPRGVRPDQFVLSRFTPRLPSSKPDRAALSAAAIPDAGVETEYAAPRDELEAVVCEVWSDTLAGARIGLDDNFLWRGGDSLAALRAARALRRRVQADGMQEGQRERRDVTDQRAEAGLIVDGNFGEESICALAEPLGPLAPCELLARPTPREYAAFLKQSGVSTKGSSRQCHRPLEEQDSDLHRASVAAAGAGCRSLLSALLHCGAPVVAKPGTYTALHAAAVAGSSHCVETLLAAGASPSAATAAGTTPAHFAAASGSVEALAALLRGGGSPWARDADGSTVLHTAARRGDAGMVAAVLSSRRAGGGKRRATFGGGDLRVVAEGGGTEAVDAFGMTALQWAVRGGHSEAAARLRDGGARCSSVAAAAIADAARAGGDAGQVSGDAVAGLCAAVRSACDTGAAADAREAAAALCNLCCVHAANRSSAREAGAEAALVSLVGRFELSSEEDAALATAEACHCLRNLCHESVGRDRVLLAGAVPPLSALLADACGTDPPRRAVVAGYRAACALAQISLHPDGPAALAATGAGDAAASAAARGVQLEPEGQEGRIEEEADVLGVLSLRGGSRAGVAAGDLVGVWSGDKASVAREKLEWRLCKFVRWAGDEHVIVEPFRRAVWKRGARSFFPAAAEPWPPVRQTRRAEQTCSSRTLLGWLPLGQATVDGSGAVTLPESVAKLWCSIASALSR
eukprot:TRINITY_DN1976_c1_g1_i1.p1 TRINITY_DN1976_c1_g1~~TRINITY_DN1976_c1_g1_i1.p1  ORF type:complete len:1232 (+),score=334.05 TRINITY_DN1976_c1_g1_i1:228-3698(+)